MLKIIALLILGFNLPSCLQRHREEKSATKIPSSVLIIGGGPSALVAGLYACQHGAKVTIVEKREAYSRKQVVLLDKVSLQILEELSVNIPRVTPINKIEQTLTKKARKMGIKRIQGEFISFAEKDFQVIIKGKKGRKTLSYDLLIGATGAKGAVRKKLGIPLDSIAESIGVSAIVKLEKPRSFSVDTSRKGKFHLRRLVSEDYVVVFAQSRNSHLKKISRNSFLAGIKKAGWKKEAQTIATHKEKQWIDVPIRLTQAKTFINKEKNSIIIGDSAATASFFEGRGLNTAILSSKAAGNLVANLLKKKLGAFSRFNKRMKEITDKLIEQSRCLFLGEAY